MSALGLEITGIREVAVELVGAYPARLHARLAARLRVLGLTLQGIVKREHLSGQDLHVRTGAGRRSVTLQTAEAGDLLEATVGIFGGPTLGYMRAHELGFEGDVTVRAHTRRLARARRTALRRAARRVPNDPFAQAAPNAAHTVREHTRHLRISEKAYLRRALAGFRPFAELGIAEAVAEAGRA